AAADVAARQAEPEVDPGVTQGDALGAALGSARRLARLPEVGAGAHRAGAYTALDASADLDVGAVDADADRGRQPGGRGGPASIRRRIVSVVPDSQLDSIHHVAPAAA